MQSTTTSVGAATNVCIYIVLSGTENERLRGRRKLCMSTSAFERSLKSSTKTRSTSAITSAVVRRLPNTPPACTAVWRTLDPAREPCWPGFVRNDLLRSVTCPQSRDPRRSFRTREKEEAQTSGCVDKQGDYLNLITFSAGYPTLLRSAWSC